MQSLIHYSHQSLEALDLCEEIAIGYSTVNEGRKCPLKQFQNLKQARLDVDLFVKDEGRVRDDCACGGCYGSDDDQTLESWKQYIPQLVLSHQHRRLLWGCLLG